MTTPVDETIPEPEHVAAELVDFSKLPIDVLTRMLSKDYELPELRKKYLAQAGIPFGAHQSAHDVLITGGNHDAPGTYDRVECVDGRASRTSEPSIVPPEDLGPMATRLANLLNGHIDV